MTLVQSWIDSLTLLKPKNLQPFAMITLKAILEAYALMFRYFWWMLALLMACNLVPLYAHGALPPLIYIASYWLYGLLVVAVCFATRPSVAQKDCAYFWTLFKQIILFWFLLQWVPIKFVLFCLFPWHFFLILFFADSQGGLKNFLFSLWNALKMIVYNLPLLIVVGIIFYYVPSYISHNFVFQLYIMHLYDVERYLPYTMVENSIAAVLLPVVVCTYANIYIKKLHDQFDLYFKKNQ